MQGGHKQAYVRLPDVACICHLGGYFPTYQYKRLPSNFLRHILNLWLYYVIRR